jgi:hypothetical protein
MQPVKLIDATAIGWHTEGIQHVELAYAAPDSRASFFFGRVPKLGTVRGMICPGCGRIVLYGEPRGE